MLKRQRTLLYPIPKPVESLAHADLILCTEIIAHSSLPVTLNGLVITERWQTGQLSIASPIVLLARPQSTLDWKTPSHPPWLGTDRPGHLLACPCACAPCSALSLPNLLTFSSFRLLTLSLPPKPSILLIRPFFFTCSFSPPITF